jgi:calcineurin-like phosphoesterase family protein
VGNHDHVLQFGKGSKGKKTLLLIKPLWNFIVEETNIHLFYPRVVRMTHMPYLNETTKAIDVRYADKRPIDYGHILLHGHQHNRYIKSNNMIDVGFDGNLKFYTEFDIVNLINDPRTFIPSRLTGWYKKRGNKHAEKME